MVAGAARAEAVGRLIPVGAVACRRTAAWVWGFDLGPRGGDGWPVEFMVPSGRRPPRRAGCRGYRAEFEAAEVVETGGVRVTTPERTALDCARWLPRLDAVAALDRFLRAGVDPRRLADRLPALAGRPGARQLREVVALADAGAVLPGESWTRTRIADSGLPVPRTQVPVPVTGGRTLFIDLGYEQYRVGVEYDGEAHHTSPIARAHDEARRRHLRTAHDWKIIAVTKTDVLYRPRPFLAALLTELLDRGWAPDDDRLTEMATHLARLEPRRRRRR